MSRLKAYEIMKLISYLSKDYRAGVKDMERNVLPSATTASRPQRRMDLTSRVNGTGRAMCQARHVRDVRRHDLQDMILFVFFFFCLEDTKTPKRSMACQRSWPCVREGDRTAGLPDSHALRWGTPSETRVLRGGQLV